MRPRIHMLSLVACMALLLNAGTALSSQAPAVMAQFAGEPAPSFASPTLALDQLKSVLKTGDIDELAKLLGLKPAELKGNSGALVAYGLIKEGATRQLLLKDDGNRKIVLVGDMLWPLPFPLVEMAGGKWAFDTKLGLEEIINRRIGNNELSTIQTLHDYVGAQYDYAEYDWDGDGIYAFAQKLISTPGKHDGLYWAPDESHGESPASPLIETAAFGKARRGEGYFGYYYRILTGQGANVEGGKQSYIVNGNMTGGFAMIAWPVKYRVTGVQTFMISNDSVVYQKDLGDDTAERASAIKVFDPDMTWSVADE